MSWLLIAVLAYLILAVVALVDKYLLTGPIGDPKIYIFYIGLLSLAVIFIIPFIGFYVPETFQVILSLFAGMTFYYGVFWFLKSLYLFEPSRVVPAIGGLSPVITFVLIYLISQGKEFLFFWEVIAFVLLILGSVLITIEKGKSVTFKSFQFSFIAAFFLSLSFVLTKYVFLSQPFWNGFIWKTFGGIILALSFFIFFSDIRKKVFGFLNFSKIDFFKKPISNKKFKFNKVALLFIINQIAGSGSSILQNYAISLAPLVFVPVVHALSGTQYLFLLILTILFSLKFPHFFKEEISRKVILQKLFAVLLIISGLVILVFTANSEILL